jgi:hypothetical protein
LYSATWSPTVRAPSTAFPDDQVKRLQRRVESLSRKLTSETIHLKAADLGAPSAAPITGSMVSDTIQHILDQIQTSLNYADVGALVPLFAEPGGNPTDGTKGCPKLDYFWQHHLGNYLKYLNQQYGG